MTRIRAQGILAAGVGIVSLGAMSACSDPVNKTDLRPEGDPEVLSVMVLIDDGFGTELATFCKPDDDKVPGILPGGQQVCPEVGSDDPPVSTVANADPLAWWTRVVFDELLDTDIEVLVDGDDPSLPCTDESITCAGHIDTTQPVVIDCGGTEIAYDGWYDPTGNAVTLPPGPSLLIYPLDFVATSTTCTLTINDNVVDKEGRPVPEAQRNDAAYTWTLSPLAIAGTDPAADDDTAELATDGAIVISFNSLIDAATAAGDIVLNDGTADVAATITADGTDLIITPDAALTADTEYTLTLADGAELADIGGGPYTQEGDLVITFTAVAP